MADYLAEAFQQLRLLEDDFDLSADRNKIDELKSFVADDIEVPKEEIIDIEAVSEDDLADNYNGKVILECECCHARMYKDISDVYVDDETDTANIDEECPVCNNSLGYSVIGKISPYEKAKDIDVNVETQDDREIEDPELESLSRTVEEGLYSDDDKTLDEISEELGPDDIIPTDDEDLEEGCCGKKKSKSPLKKFKEACKNREALDDESEEINESSKGNAWTKLVSEFPELEEDLETCPECGKTPCECDNFEGTGMSEKDIRDLSYDDMEKMGIYDESLKESVEVSAQGEDNVKVSKKDDGSMDINVSSTEPGEGEEIMPLGDEDMTSIESNESPAEAEEPSEEEPSVEGEAEPVGEGEETEPEEEEIEEIDNEAFDNMGESFLHRVYSNAKSFTTTRVISDDNTLMVEGLITFRSGAKRKSSFVFTNNYMTKNNKLVLEGYNHTFSNKEKSFRVLGNFTESKFYPTALKYNFRTKALNESNQSEAFRVQGIVKLDKLKSLNR